MREADPSGVRAVASQEETHMTLASAPGQARHDPDPPPVQHGPRRPRLSCEEEAELAAQIARGDRQARDRLVEANLGLVRAIAHGFRGRGLEIDDLIGEGHLGLIRATGKFDPSHSVPFSTYAAYWIKEAIRAALINTTPTIRLPAFMVRLLARWWRAERALSREMGRAPGFEELAATLDLSEAQRSMVARALQSRRVRTEGGPDEAGDQGLAGMSDEHGRVEARAEAEDERASIRRRIERLDDREQAILKLHFGLDGEALTLEQIGCRLGVTRQWARKVELLALQKLGDESAGGPPPGEEAIGRTRRPWGAVHGHVRTSEALSSRPSGWG
jgi:RNA polymerase primary sigma factor